MTTWKLKPADEAAVSSLAVAMGLPRPIARILYLRGYRVPLDARRFRDARESLDYLATPLETPGMNKAVARIRKAVETGERFVIYGDYDCDGVTSTTVLYRYLKRGLKANCEAYLPDRFKDGYGVTAAAVERIAAAGTKLILTCDNGISATAAAERAKELGVEIVVTDHHKVPDELPDVHAIVHPELEFPHLKDMAGVGVAYLFTLALEGQLNARMETFLDFVTMGTVGDVVPLDGPNRPLVWAGLERFRASRTPYPGVKALLKVAKSNADELTAQDVGFQLVPRLNAAGRLETPDIGFRLLATNEMFEAEQHAARLDTINRERRELSAELEARIIARVEREWDFDAEPFVVLSDETFHHGITGIIAGRLKERYRVPVLLFSGHGADAPWKASGRAPEGVHLYEALHSAREHLLGFGGHAGAAGCAAKPAELDAVRRILNQHVRSIGWKRPDDTIEIDALLPFADANERLLEELDRLEPFGQRNPMPVFGLFHAKVIRSRVVKTHLFLTVDDGTDVREMVAWNKAGDADKLQGYVRFTYSPRISLFRGRHVELVVQRIEPDTPPPAIVLTTARRPAVDRRGEDLGRLLAALDGEADLYALPGRLDHVPAGITLLDPFAPKPSGGPLILADLPHDLATWEALSAAVPHTMAWLPTPEEPLTPDWLTTFYLSLARTPGRSLESAIAALPAGQRQPAMAAVAVLREAGLLVARGRDHQVLDASDREIVLAELPAFKAAQEAARFRAAMKDLPPTELVPGWHPAPSATP